MPLLNICQTVGRALRAEPRNYFFAVIAMLLAAILPVPGRIHALAYLLVAIWAALCLLSAFPDKRLAAMKKKFDEEKTFGEKTIQERENLQQSLSEATSRQSALADMLSTQFYLRITERLRAEGFSGTSWDFLTPHPDEALAAGSEVRIKLTGAGEYQTADVQIHPRSGVLTMRISKPIQDVPQEPVAKVRKIVQSPARKADDRVLCDWLRQNASAVEDAGFEANKKGLTSYTYSKNLPADKGLWPRIGELLIQDEFYEKVTPTDDGLCIQIKNWGAQAVG